MPQERLDSLQRKHSMLSALIEREESLPSANDSYIRQLKRQKLMIKDILSGVRADLMEEAREHHQMSGRA